MLLPTQLLFLLQATFEGWMELMDDAVDSKEVIVDFKYFFQWIKFDALNPVFCLSALVGCESKIQYLLLSNISHGDRGLSQLIYFKLFQKIVPFNGGPSSWSYQVFIVDHVYD